MEMIQVRKQDIRHEKGDWIVRLTPDAGTLKTNKYRDVPIHQHLIELGFIEFVNTCRDGPLFCATARNGKLGSAEGVYSRLREFIRGVIVDPAVQPNHAWRYTFKVRGLFASAATDDIVARMLSKYVFSSGYCRSPIV
jgi:hypothetical protein